MQVPIGGGSGRRAERVHVFPQGSGGGAAGIEGEQQGGIAGNALPDARLLPQGCREGVYAATDGRVDPGLPFQQEPVGTKGADMTGEAHPGKVRITQKVVLFALTSPPTAMPNDPDEDDLKRYYSIGEVAKKLGVNTSLIRFWENEFSHIKPNKNSRGDRRFTKENIQQLREVYHLVRERGFTLDGARREIASAGKPQAGKQEVIDRLLAVRGRLKALRDA